MAKGINLAELATDHVPDSSPRGPRTAGISELPIDRIAANPLNQRTDADEDPAELEALVATIRQHGVLQPLVVATAAAFLACYPDQAGALDGARWVTLIGNRRLRAAGIAECRQVPAVVNDGHAGSMFEVMLVENSHRRDLAPLREAEAMRRVLDRDDITQDDLAKRIGRTGAYVTQRLHLLGLIPALRAALDSGELTVERGRELGRLAETEQETIAAAGPPYRPGRVINGVKTRPRARTLPTGDPVGAARSIRELYSGPQLAELIRLLSANDPAPEAGE